MRYEKSLIKVVELLLYMVYWVVKTEIRRQDLIENES